MQIPEQKKDAVGLFEQKAQEVREIIEQVADELKRAEGFDQMEYVYPMEEVLTNVRIIEGQVDKLKAMERANWEALTEGISNGLEKVRDDAQTILTELITERDGTLDTTE